MEMSRQLLHPARISLGLFLLAFFSACNAQWRPKDLFLIDCGSFSNTSSSSNDDRQWQGESQPAFASSAGVSINTSVQNPNLPSAVPYLTARVFTARSNYSFPVDPGRHWLRLHFYPFPTPGFDPNAANFSVSVGPYTLLNGNISEIVANSGRVYLVKEFAIVADASQLVVVFQPSVDSFAFVNGIEVMSMPEDALQDDGVLLGSGVQTKFGFSRLALQTMYRLNVGGASVNVMNDTQERAWEPDQKYIEGAAAGVPTQDYSSDIKFSRDVPDYIAPAAVYGTGRVLGISNTVSNNFKISWRFAVSSGYHYLVRLHFAELNFDQTYQRVFNVYINNKTAIDGMDLIALGTKYSPIFRDFIVLSTGLQSLRVQIGPTSGSVSQYSDAILNGLEIFKMNSTEGNLLDTDVGGFADPSLKRATSTSKAPGAIVGAVVGGIAALALAVGFCFFCRRTKRGKLLSPAWRPVPSVAGTSVVSIGYPPSATTASHYASTPANPCRHFSLQQIVEATNNFDDDLLLGVGGFGKVYKGEVEGGLQVAVKRGNPMSEQGLTEFQTEIEMLSKLRHRHLVSLIGYCEENSEMILVYDYMANGPLRGHLYGATVVPPLSWKQRLEICIGAARGLHYLHTGAQRAIIHRDVKTTNILLDENFVAKVSDFGLSKVGPSLEHTHVSTAVKGSFGYLDPEYFRRQQLTEKSDVYSFGVVLMEVFCARPAINPSLPRDQMNIAEWALHWQKMGMLESIMDPKLEGDCTLESLQKFGEVAERCLADRGSERPSIGDVLWNLEFSLQLHEAARIRSGGENANQARSLELMPLRGYNNEREGNPISSHSHEFSRNDSEDASASVVFSQLVNPQGR